MRQALRLYQLVDARLASGDTLFAENKMKKRRAEVIFVKLGEPKNEET
jgi:hypothetical protein